MIIFTIIIHQLMKKNQEQLLNPSFSDKATNGRINSLMMTANGDCRPNGKCGFNQIIYRYSVCQALRCFQYLYCPVVTHSLCCWAFWFPVTGSTVTRTKQLVVRLSQVIDFLSFGLYGPNCSASSYRRSTRCNISYSLF